MGGVGGNQLLETDGCRASDVRSMNSYVSRDKQNKNSSLILLLAALYRRRCGVTSGVMQYMDISIDCGFVIDMTGVINRDAAPMHMQGTHENPFPPKQPAQLFGRKRHWRHNCGVVESPWRWDCFFFFPSPSPSPSSKGLLVWYGQPPKFVSRICRCHFDLFDIIPLNRSHQYRPRDVMYLAGFDNPRFPATSHYIWSTWSHRRTRIDDDLGDCDTGLFLLTHTYTIAPCVGTAWRFRQCFSRHSLSPIRPFARSTVGVVPIGKLQIYQPERPDLRA